MSTLWQPKIPKGWRVLKPNEIIMAGDRPYAAFIERFLKPLSQFSMDVGIPVQETDFLCVIRKDSP